MADVRLENVTKRFGDVVAVEELNLKIKDQEFLVLVGPSGCGKSTALRLIAGLETPTEGSIYIGDTLVNRLPPKDRDIAMVFQSYALYPHKNVYENIAFPLKLRKTPREEVDNLVREAAELLGISPLLERKPKELSGGQRQRVALGRAIVRKPRVFLMDEPLSNLDAKLRVGMRAELKRLQDRLKVTTIYVTHDQVEAMTMGDRIAILKDGILNQVGTPSEVFDRPANRFIAGFIGSPPMNFLDATVRIESGRADLDFEVFAIRLDEEAGKTLKKHGGRWVSVGIRPQHIYDKRLARDPRPEWTVEAEVDVVEPLGTEIIAHLRRGGIELVAQFPSDAEIESGGKAEIVIDGENLHVFDPENEEAIV